jgi:beta-lactamase regulating signal transducer with metallopeptidase domain
MFHLVHSAFLKALGYAIINSLWQFALLWLVYFVTISVFKPTSAQKYVTGLLLELAGFGWFIGTLIFYYAECSIQVNSGYIASVATATINVAPTIKQKVFQAVLQTEQFFPYLAIAYLALLCFLLCKWLYAYYYTHSVKIKGLQKIDAEWRLFVQKLSFQLGIKRAVKIYLSELVQTPLTIGFFKPIILIPLASINHLTVPQLEAVILHELAHIKRSDYFYNLLLAIVEACLFFNPFMQLISAHIKRERENCCDDWVIQYEYNAASYARALLQIASCQTRSPLLALKATDDKKLLLNRIKRIIEKKERTFFNYKHQLMAMLVLTTVLSSLAVLTKSKKINKPATSFKHVRAAEPIAANIDNPLFNPVFFLADASKKVTQQKKKQDAQQPARTFIRVDEAMKAPEDLAFNDNEEITEAVTAPAPPVEKKQEEVDSRYQVMFENMQDNLLNQNKQFQIDNRFSVDFNRQKKQAEREAKKFGMVRLHEKAVVIDQENVKRQMEKALAKIKMAKKQLTLINVGKILDEGMKNLEKQRGASDNTIKLEQLELLENQIQKNLDAAKLFRYFETSADNDAAFNIQFPLVMSLPAAPGEQPHSFSFELAEKPTFRAVIPETFERQIRKNKRQQLQWTQDQGNNCKPDENPAAAKPTRLSIRAFVIKI